MMAYSRERRFYLRARGPVTNYQQSDAVISHELEGAAEYLVARQFVSVAHHRYR
jgi:hypothetical protein